MQRVLNVSALLLFVFALMPLFKTSGAKRSRQAEAAQSRIDFVRDIQPVFEAHCAQCHGAQKAMSQLRLDHKKLALRVSIPGNGQDSRLVQRLLGEGGEDRMPEGGEPLKPEQIELIKRWIDEGANWPESDAATGRPGEGS